MKYNAVTVTQLNKYLKDRFDEDENLNAILVKGEISNFKNHYTGHLYFTLKDENSLIDGRILEMKDIPIFPAYCLMQLMFKH